MVERFLSGDQNQATKKNVTREQFGDGHAGDYAFNVIKSGSKCEAIDPVENKKCVSDAVQTLDFDISGTMEIAPNCGDEHAAFLRDVIARDLARYNQITAFSKNGWGRERA